MIPVRRPVEMPAYDRQFIMQVPEPNVEAGQAVELTCKSRPGELFL